MDKLIFSFSGSLTSIEDRSDDAAQDAIRFVPNKELLTAIPIGHRDIQVVIMPAATIATADEAVTIDCSLGCCVVIQKPQSACHIAQRPRMQSSRGQYRVSDSRTGRLTRNTVWLALQLTAPAPGCSNSKHGHESFGNQPACDFAGRVLKDSQWLK